MDIMNSLQRLVLVLTFALSTAGCNTSRPCTERTEVLDNQSATSMVEVSLRDRFDSIYVLHDRSLTALHDTVWTTERITEYRYRYVHDTVFVARTDTLIMTDSIAVTLPPPREHGIFTWGKRGGERSVLWFYLLGCVALIAVFFERKLKQIKTK